MKYYANHPIKCVFSHKLAKNFGLDFSKVFYTDDKDLFF